MNSETNKDTIDYSTSECSGKLVAGTRLDQWLKEGNTPADLFRNTNKLIKSDTKTQCGVVRLTGNKDRKSDSQLFVKEYRQKRNAGLSLSTFGKRRAKNVWSMSWHLISQNISVPQPAGFFVYNKGSRKGVGYYCCEPLIKTKCLADIAYYDKPLFDRLVNGDFFDAVAAELAEFYRLNISHGDMKWTNILVNEQSEKFWFVDLDACKKNSDFRQNKLAARDVARFVVGAIEADLNDKMLIHFLLRYAEGIGTTVEVLKDAIRVRVQKLLKRKGLAEPHSVLNRR